MSAEELYKLIKRILEKGNDVEIKTNKDGEIVVYEIKKHKITK